MMQSIIELSRTQDEEVGDGTTSVIILGKDPISLQHFPACHMLVADALHGLAVTAAPGLP